MGSDRSTGTRLAARCCYGAYFALGFVITTITFAVMFWIVWCYFGLTLVQFTDTQRRAVVNYSYTTTKPSASPTSSPSVVPRLESSVANSIAKSSSTALPVRGSSRGESQVQIDKGKDRLAVSSPSASAKGDHAARNRTSGVRKSSTNDTAYSAQDSTTSTAVSSQIPGKAKPGNDEVVAAAILSGSSEDSAEEDGLYPRKVSTSGGENDRPAGSKEDAANNAGRRRSPDLVKPSSRPDIEPTKVHVVNSGRSRRPDEPDRERPDSESAKREPQEFLSKDRITPERHDVLQSSGRPDSEPPYRDPEFEREHPRKTSTNLDRGRPRYEDIDYDRSSVSRADKRDRGRDTDDRYSKGDRRVYPDEILTLERDRVRVPISDDRYLDRDDRSRTRDDRVIDKYAEDPVRRGDDDRYYRDRDLDRSRDRDDRYRYPDTDSKPRLEIRPRDDAYLPRDDRYRSDDRIRPRDDDRIRLRDDDRIRPHDEDRIRPIYDDRLRPRDEDRIRPRDDDRIRPRDDDRIIPRDDDRIRPRDKDRIRPRDDDRIRPRDDDRIRPRDDDRIRPRDDDRIKPREDERIRLRDDDRTRPLDDTRYIPREEIKYLPTDANYRSRDEDRYRDRAYEDRDRVYESAKYLSRPSDDKDVYASRAESDSRIRDREFRDSVPSVRSDTDLLDRKPLVVRLDAELRDERRISEIDSRDRSRTYSREDILPSRVELPSRAAASAEKYRDEIDEYRRPSRYVRDDDIISPTRTRDEIYVSRSSLTSSRPRDEDRYIDDRKETIGRDDRYYDDADRNRNIRIDGSRDSISLLGSSRRDSPRDEFRTRLPQEKRVDEVVLDRRSYASEEDDEYRTRNSQTRTAYDYDDRDRRLDDSKRDIREDSKILRAGTSEDVDDYRRSRPRGDYEDDRYRYRGKTDDEYRRYDRVDDRYISRTERYGDMDDRPPIPARKYDKYPSEEDGRMKRRDSDVTPIRTLESRVVERARPDRTLDSSSGIESRNPYKASDVRRYDEVPVSQDRRGAEDVYPVPQKADSRSDSLPSRQSSNSRDSLLGTSQSTSAYSRESSRVHENRYPSSGNSREAHIRGDHGEDMHDSLERPMSTKEVIEAALRQTDSDEQKNRKVFYPVFDPRVSNLTTPDFIRQGERRGTTITARRRRKRTMELLVPK